MSKPDKMTGFSFNHADQVDNYGVVTGNSTIVKSNFDSRAMEVLQSLNAWLDYLETSGAEFIGTDEIPGLEGTTVQELLESLDAELAASNALLREQLQSTAEGDSGADFVGATSIAGLSGNTVQAILRSLKTLVDALTASQIAATPPSGTTGNDVQAVLNSINERISQTVIGQIPDGSLTDAKLSDDAGQVKDRLQSHADAAAPHTGHATTADFAAHKADTMPHKTADGGYRWGLRINPDLSATIIYEVVG